MRATRLVIVGLVGSLVGAGALGTGQAWAQKRQGSALASRGTSLRSLPALGAVAPKKNDTVPGRVGVVRGGSVTIRAGRQPSDTSLALATEGMNLAVLIEKEGFYGVLMQDSTLGWVPTTAVELLDYRVEVRLPEIRPTQPDPAPRPDPAPSAPQITTDDPAVAGLFREAFTYLGVPYVWAGNTRRGLDCSAFLKNVFRTAWGVDLPRHSGDQAKVGKPIASTDDLIPGDRLYFDMGHKGRISHCGIYIGNGYFIHASSNRHCVGVDSLTTGNYWSCLSAARRDR